MKPSISCAIVGAGMTGLMAARELQSHGIKVIVIDKGRSVGGRMATRWIEIEGNEKGFFDHGAQFFTVRDPWFQSFVDEWISAGLVREWARGFAQGDDLPHHDGHPRYCGTAGMNAIARHLATGLDVRVNTKVESLTRQAEQWSLALESGAAIQADALLLTPPVPQSLALLNAGDCSLPDGARHALERITYDSCFAVMAVLDAPARLPEPGALQLQQEPIAWIADNHRKGISPDAFTVTIHAGPDFTREHWEADHETVARKLLHAAGEWVRAPVKSWQVHRWRYSQPRLTHPEPCLFVNDAAPLIFAGDAFGAPRVEGAALSGLAAAAALLKRV
ncbi:MAG: FAD-dependent oxidoreductase [Blastocatellia bacterium]|nr:FAD-dependent oxidoreductase [Blastocatellia bacterium]